MTFQEFSTYSKVKTSQQNYSNMAYFVNYQRISISIETSAKCRKFTVMQLKADALLFKTKFIYSILSFYAVLLSNIVFYCVQKLMGKHVFRKIDIIHMWHILSSGAHKRNPVDISNLKCK